MIKADKEYTLKDAVKLFYKCKELRVVECIRNEQDLSDKILELDMGKSDKFLLRFEGFMFLVQDLDCYKVTILVKNGIPTGFKFTPSRREYYRFSFKV